MDIVIVGCGFSGLYTAYRLLQKNSNFKITIYEKSEKIGGRIYTETYMNHILEYGPMRFEPELQPKFANLLKELDITYKEFSAYTTPYELPDYNKIDLKEIEFIENNKDLAPAFALLKYALKNILNEQWDLDKDDIKDPSRDSRKTWLKRNARFQGHFLYNLGLWDTLAHVLSKPAIDYIMQNGTFYHMIAVNPNAIDIMSFILDILATCKYHLITINNGTMTIIDKLYELVKDKINIVLNQAVDSFEEKDNEIIVRVGKDEVTTNRLILTCQKTGIQNIRGFNKNIEDLFDTIFVIKLYKIFIIIENAPWNQDTLPRPNYGADKIPCREVHYFYKDNTGMIMIYGDVPSLHYWRTFSRNINYESKERLKDHLYHYLRKMFPGSNMNIIHYDILDWSNPPNETGVHIWRPGMISSEIGEKLSCFGKHKNIHICGEAYSEYQGFIEGCIRSVDKVLLII